MGCYWLRMPNHLHLHGSQVRNMYDAMQCAVKGMLYLQQLNSYCYDHCMTRTDTNVHAQNSPRLAQADATFSRTSYKWLFARSITTVIYFHG